MIIETKKDIFLKSGKVIKKNSTVNVSVLKDKPWIAIVEKDNITCRIKSASLHLLSNSFIEITESMLMDSIIDDCVPSLTGCYVEPDGWDPEGFPSILLAMGFILQNHRAGIKFTEKLKKALSYEN